MDTNILIIFVLSLASLGRTYEVEVTLTCEKQIYRQRRLSNDCQNQLVYHEKFYQDLNETLIDVSGEDVDVSKIEGYFTKYCDIMPQYMDCYNLTYDMSDECQVQIPNREMKMFGVRLFRSLASYACENNADMLKKLLPYRGFAFFIEEDEDFERCTEHVKVAEFESLNDICLAVDIAEPCFEDSIGQNHTNKDLIVIIRELSNRIKSDANCNA